MKDQQKMENQFTGIVLAGGKSSRMGKNKALVPFNNRPMVDWAIDKLTPLCSSVLVSSNTFLPGIQTKIIPDIYTDIGPLGGLYASLLASETEINLVIPCDVPLVPMDLFQLMLPFSKSYQAVVPKLPNGNLEPLIGIYNKKIIPVIFQMIQNKDYKLLNLFSFIQVYYFEVQDVSIFKNINTPMDLL